MAPNTPNPERPGASRIREVERILKANGFCVLPGNWDAPWVLETLRTHIPFPLKAELKTQPFLGPVGMGDASYIAIALAWDLDYTAEILLEESEEHLHAVKEREETEKGLIIENHPPVAHPVPDTGGHEGWPPASEIGRNMRDFDPDSTRF